MGIVLCSDWHSEINTLYQKLQYCLEKKDIIFGLGDIGVLGTDKFANFKNTFYFIQGNHDAPFDESAPYSTSQVFLPRDTYVYQEVYGSYFGKVFSIIIDHYKILCVGGASSIDRYYRLFRATPESHPLYKILGDFVYQFDEISNLQKAKIDSYLESSSGKINWWKENEDISDAEFEWAKQEAKTATHIFSHTCPFNFIPNEVKLAGVNRQAENFAIEHKLQEIYNVANYNVQWYCGHWHTHKHIGNVTFIDRNEVIII